MENTQETTQQVETQHQKVASPSERSPLTGDELAEVLMQANKACVARTTPLLKMLGVCKQQFALYADSHRAKGTEEGDQKAATNQTLVTQIDEVLHNFQQRLEEDTNDTTGKVGAD